MSTPTPINLDEVKKKAHEAVAGLSKDDLIKLYVKERVRTKVQQKKQADKGGQKAYMKKQAEMRKLVKARIEELGLTEELNAQAEPQIDEKYNEYLEAATAEEEAGQEEQIA